MKKFGRIVHGVYTILATYLLGWVVYFAIVAFGFHVATDWLVGFAGFDRPDAWWRYVAARVRVSTLTVRLVAYGGLHVVLLVVGWNVVEWLQGGAESTFDAIHRWFRRVTSGRRTTRTVVRGLFTVAVTLVLVPFVLQPTLVGDWSSSRSWLRRTANLADGTASRYIVDSVVGEYRTWFVDAVDSVGGVEPADVEPRETADRDPADPPPAPTGEQPMMDRWDPLLREVADDNPEAIARLKAVMWVESAGRQFAVSHTGCAGLMQFCSGTARSRPFRSVFGTGTVYNCDCDGRCAPPEEFARALETGDDRPQNADEQFPCELTDARFDPEKSLRAARLYLRRLGRKFGDNLLLIYIGYNSGPAVARRVWRRIGRDERADLTDIEPHLAEAMRPHFPDSATSRARSLIQTHLPKLRAAHDRYLREADAHIARRPSADSRG